MNQGRKVFLLSPFAKSIVKLPSLPEHGAAFIGFTFTSSPNSVDCLILGMTMIPYSDCSDVGVHTLSLQQKKWETKRRIFYPPLQDACHTNPVYHNGKLYCLCWHGELCVFDPNSSTLGWTVLRPVKMGSQAYFNRNYLLECDGELIVVFTGHDGRDVSVFKWDEPNLIWKQVHDIGEYMIFLSKTTSFATKRTKADDYMKNKIYFPNLHQGYVESYCFKECVFQTFGNNFQLDNPQVLLECCWMEPIQHDGSLTGWFESEDSGSQSDEDDVYDEYKYCCFDFLN